MSRLALTGATVVTSLDPPTLLSADVSIEGGRVTAVGTAPDGIPRYDCTGCLIVPGNVCAHTHLYSSLARGMPYRLDPPTTFLQILQRVWWRLDRALDESSIEASALLGGMDALLTGTSTLIDHHASPNAIQGSLDIVAEALERLGVRSILCYEVTDRDGAEKAMAGVEENRRFLPVRRALARGMVGAHASFTLSEETLAACVETARDAGAGLHVHVAEDSIDQQDCEARLGMGVVQRLLEAGVPPGDSLFAHCVHLHPSEIELLRRSQVTVAHNPRSNMNNGVGRAPVERLGVPVALGTDGLGADMFAEARVAYFRRREEDQSTPPEWAVLRLAEGATFAGHLFDEPELGTIEPGAPADLVVLEYAAPTALTADNLLAHWIFGLGARHVRDVLVDGEVVVRDRRLVRVDQDTIVAEANRQAEHLWRRMEDIGPHPFAPEAA